MLLFLIIWHAKMTGRKGEAVMDLFAQNLRRIRKEKGLNQSALGDRIGVSQRTITDYETGKRKPHRSTLQRLLEALDISESALYRDPHLSDASNDAREAAIEKARLAYGSRGERELSDLLSRNAMLFAGGKLSEEAKDAFYEAITVAYLTAKEEASHRSVTASLSANSEVSV